MMSTPSPKSNAQSPHRQCLYCGVRERSPCGGLRDVESLDLLEQARSSARRVGPGEPVVAGGQDLAATYTILSGMVAITETLADGRHMILRFALPGDILVQEQLASRTARAAIAIGDVTVCAFTRARHVQLLRDDALYRGRYNAALNRELNLAYGHLAELALGNARERVAGLLFELAWRTLRREPTSVDRIHLPLTQVQVGLATGLTAVHVSRTLRHLAEEGLILFEARQIGILNPDAVKRLAGASEETIQSWM